jgi:hypothetical protein
MKLVFRPRITLMRSMVIVAAVAILLAVFAAIERRRRIETLTAEFQRSQARLDWAASMHVRGYVSKAQLAEERRSRDQVRSQLEALGARPDRP